MIPRGKIVAVLAVVMMLSVSVSFMVVEPVSSAGGSTGDITVTFHDGNGDQVDTQSFTSGVGQNLKLISGISSTKEKLFVGWSTTKGGSVTYANGQYVTFTSDTKLYPVYRDVGTTSGNMTKLSSNTVALDLSLGNVIITPDSFKGSFYLEVGDKDVKVDVSGTKGTATIENVVKNGFKISYSTTEAGVVLPVTSGFIEGDVGNIVFDVYQSSNKSKNVVQTWSSTGGFSVEFYSETDALNGVDLKSGTIACTNISAVAKKWYDDNGNHTPTSNYIQISKSGVSSTGQFNVILNGVWSTANGESYTTLTGGLVVNTDYGGNASNSYMTNTLVNIFTQGNNRFAAIAYANSQNSTSLVFDTVGDGSVVVTSLLGMKGEDGKTDVVNGNNHWNSAIGACDTGGENCYGLYFNGGIVYAGTTKTDNCTAIGAGGNGKAEVNINGGSIYAISNSTGTAIGGGIGEGSPGGEGIVRITGGYVYAYNGANFSVSNTTTYIPAVAIGGGSSRDNAGSNGNVFITGGEVYAYSVGGAAIGGGGSNKMNGGSTTIQISGTSKVTALSSGYQEGNVLLSPATSIGGGTSLSGAGGSATLIVSGGDVITGSIGGGVGVTSTGTATVSITGGTLQGQVIMSGGSFKMSGGVMDGTGLKHINSEGGVAIEESGGALHIKEVTSTEEDPYPVTISGDAEIRNYTFAKDGGAVYIGSGSFRICDNAKITYCSASGNGGAVYVDGEFVMDNGSISNNTATGYGGAVFVGGVVNNNKFDPGDFLMNNGSIQYNTGSNGGGVYVHGETVEGIFSTGSFTMNNGEIKNNSITGTFDRTGKDAFVYEADYEDPIGKVYINGGAIGDKAAMDPYFVISFDVYVNGEKTVINGRMGSDYAFRNGDTYEFHYLKSSRFVTVTDGSAMIILKDLSDAITVTLGSNSILDLNAHAIKATLSGAGNGSYVMDGSLEGKGPIDFDCTDYQNPDYPMHPDESVYRFYKYVTITYDKNGDDVTGDVPSSVSGFNVLLSIKDKGDLSLSGGAFRFWNTSPNGTGKTYNPDDNAITIHSDITLYAIWASDVVVDFTFSLEDAGQSIESQNFSATKGQTYNIGLITPDLKFGYIVTDGWTIVGGVDGVTATITSDKLTITINEDNVRGNLECRYVVAEITYYVVKGYDINGLVDLTVTKDSSDPEADPFTISKKIGFNVYESEIYFPDVDHYWDASTGQKYYSHNGIELTQGVIDVLDGGDITLHLVYSSFKVAIDTSKVRDPTFRGEAVTPIENPDGSRTINIPDKVGSCPEDYVFAGWYVNLQGNTDSIIMATGSSITVNVNCELKPILIPESQYHGSLTIGSS